MSPPSERFGPYRVVGRLGDGALARVLLGEDPDGRRVAITIVIAEPPVDAGLRERFRQEVRAAAVVPAWCMAPVLDADTEAELPWLVTAFVGGPPLGAYIAATGPLGEAAVTALGIQLADALAALHRAGFTHRDLTPSAVLLADDGPRLIGSGPALAAAGPGRAVGPPQFRAPELAGGTVAGPAGDVFALGAVLGFAASGRSPLAGGPVAAMPGDRSAAAVRDGGGSPAPGRGVTGGPDLGALAGPVRVVIAACLAQDPDRRPTAAQVGALLRSSASSGDGPAPAAMSPAVTVVRRDAAAGHGRAAPVAGGVTSSGDAAGARAAGPPAAVGPPGGGVAPRVATAAAGNGVPAGRPAPSVFADLPPRRADPDVEPTVILDLPTAIIQVPPATPDVPTSSPDQPTATRAGPPVPHDRTTRTPDPPLASPDLPLVTHGVLPVPPDPPLATPDPPLATHDQPTATLDRPTATLDPAGAERATVTGPARPADTAPLPVVSRSGSAAGGSWPGAPGPSARAPSGGPRPPGAPPGPGGGPRPGRGRSSARLRVVLAVLVAVLLAGGITLLLARPAPDRSPATSAAQRSATGPADGSSAPVSDPAAGTTPVDPATLGGDAPRFASPSRNIACVIAGGGARCDVVIRSWQVPPRPAGCRSAWATGALVGRTGAGVLTCAPDTLADRGLPVLGYGQSVTLAGVGCVSRDTGIRCAVVATGHGFEVARGGYELF